MKNTASGFITFLGTAGARFVVTRQLRASGGIWLNLENTGLLVDPGPGCLVHGLRNQPPLDPLKINGIFLSHKHLDHSGDLNVMIEAVTNGGFTKRGVLFAPGDALSDDPVVSKHLRPFLKEIVTLRERGEYRLGPLHIRTPVRHLHGVETYGFRLDSGKKPVISYIPDSRYFSGIAEAYEKTDILIINTVFYERREGFMHLSLPEAEEIIRHVRPRKAILTHFGMTMLRKRIWEKTAEISERAGAEVIAASDGMTISLS